MAEKSKSNEQYVAFFRAVWYNIFKITGYFTSDATKERMPKMDIQSNVANNIKKYRKEQGLSQESLAEKLGVTSQAVSKWECMQSIPDIEAMVEICRLMGISLDKLVLDKEPEVVVQEVVVEKEREEHYDRRGFFNKIYFDALPDDNDLRVLQFKGRRLLRENDYDRKIRIPLAIDNDKFPEKTVNVHIVGNADIEGDISGGVNAGDSVNCGNVGASVRAGDSVNCGNVGASVHAGDGVNCGNVGASVSAGDSVNCGNVGNSVSAGDNIRCGDVNTITKCGGDIHCKCVTGTIKHCDRTVYVG